MSNIYLKYKSILILYEFIEKSTFQQHWLECQQSIIQQLIGSRGGDLAEPQPEWQSKVAVQSIIDNVGLKKTWLFFL